MPSRVRWRMFWVLFFASFGILAGFRLLVPERGPFQPFRVETTLHYTFESPFTTFNDEQENVPDSDAPRPLSFDDIVTNELGKAQKELNNENIFFGSPETTAGSLLAIAIEAPTMELATRFASSITSRLTKQFQDLGISIGPISYETKGKQPAFSLGGNAFRLAFYKPSLKHVKLGLDLRGGVRMVLQCRRAEIQYELETPVGQSLAKQSDAKFRIGKQLHAESLQEYDLNFDDQGKFLILHSQAKNDVELNTQKDIADRAVQLELGAFKHVGDTPRLLEFDETDTVESVIETIRRRVDKFSVAEPQIYRQGEDRVVVELPGVQNLDEARQRIEGAAKLEIKLVPAETYTIDVERNGEKKLVVFRDKDGNTVPQHKIYLESTPIISGDDMISAVAGFDEFGQPEVSFVLADNAGNVFSQETGKNIGNHLGIWLDGLCISAPVLEARIGKQGRITGGFTNFDEAKRLQILLESGRLTVPISPIWEKEVSPTLGRETIAKSIAAGLAGLILIVIFMVFYYRLPGLLATISLALYATLVLAVFSFHILGWEPTLTLPGIIAFILSIGMAVDANIIIFERLKEELRLGKTLRAAIDTAFDRAWTAILDASVTTLIAAFVLAKFGTGPIKGFAVTLSIGILCSMFSAIVATKALLELAAYTGLSEKRGLWTTLADSRLIRSLTGQRIERTTSVSTE